MAKPYVYQAYGILNPVGDVWGPEWFETVDSAHDHLARFWAAQASKVDLSEFRIVPVEVTIRAIDGAGGEG